LQGKRVAKPPFWEVWFCMGGLAGRRYGDCGKMENRVKMAKDLGMSAMVVSGIDTNVGFAQGSAASDGTGHYSGGSLTDLKQLEERKLPDWSDTIAKGKEEQRAVNEAGYISWLILPWCFHTVATSMGLENLAYRVYDDFDFVDRVFEWVEERNRIAIETAVAQIKPDFVLFDGDCAHKTGLMVNPEMFRRLVFDKTKKTVSCLQKLGIPYTIHTDGKLDDVIPLLVELGFSAVHGCEKQANDLNHLVEEFGDDIVLVGNMDVVFLTNATPDQVRRETEEMLRIGSKKGKFAAACNTSPMDYIPDENYLAMVETIKSF